MALDSKNEIRLRIHKRIRRRVAGTQERPRLAVFRSLNHIYAQVIDDAQGFTLAAAATTEKDLRGKGGNIEGAKVIGRKVAERAKEKGITKVVKGGKNMSFSALVVVGDPSAKVVGFGTGKAKEVPSAIKKGIESAKKNLRKINVLETTILHPVLGRFGSGLVLLKPAPAGTGVIAGGPVRAVIQAVGIPNVLTKSSGSHNAHNVVKATIDALEQLCDKTAVADMRGLPVEKL